MLQISRRRLVWFGAGVTALGAVTATRRAFAQRFDDGLPMMGNAYSVMASDDRLTTWVRLIDRAGLQQHAAGATPYTLFAQTDAEFEAAPQTVERLLGPNWQTEQASSLSGTFSDPSDIVRFLRAHVIAGKVLPAALAGKASDFNSLIGTKLRVDGTAQPMRVTWTNPLDGKARTAQLDGKPMVCTNAVVYVLDKVETV